MLRNFFKNDHYLIESIKKGGLDREKALEYCYKSYFKYQTNIAKKYSGLLSPEDIEEAYDDAFIAFNQQIQQNKYQGKSKLSTYFYAIFNHKCIDISRRKDKNASFVDQENFGENENTGIDILEEIIQEEEKEKLLKILDKLSPICKKILLLWNDGYNLKEIAVQTGLKNANTAKAKKGSCFQKLKSIVEAEFWS